MLNELLIKIKSKGSIQNKLQALVTQKEELETKIIKQKEVLRKENNDVERLEYGKLSSFFFELLGTKEQKLSKEREEAYQAQLKYNSLESQLYMINKDITDYENKLKDIADCEIRYNELYNKQFNELKMNNDYLVQLENELLESQAHIKELNEAIHAGETALDIAHEVMSELDSAKNWSAFDMLGGGLISDLIKYEKLDAAQDLINTLASQLTRFKSELVDVQIDLCIKVEIDEFVKFADFWFDGIFSGFAVYERISDAKDEIVSVKDSIHQVLRRLNELSVNEQNNVKQLKEKIDDIVLDNGKRGKSNS